MSDGNKASTPATDLHICLYLESDLNLAFAEVYNKRRIVVYIIGLKTSNLGAIGGICLPIALVILCQFDCIFLLLGLATTYQEIAETIKVRHGS